MNEIAVRDMRELAYRLTMVSIPTLPQNIRRTESSRYSLIRHRFVVRELCLVVKEVVRCTRVY